MSASTDFAALTLVPANRAQTIAWRKKAFQQWGRGISLEEYLKGNAGLETQEHAVGGRWTTWLLVPKDDPESLNFLSACETYRRKAFVIKKGESDAEETVGYGISCVYTPPENRGKGYAKHMMRLLHWVLASPAFLDPSAFPKQWGTPPALQGNGRFSVLYTDIGEAFYRSSAPGEGTSLGEGWIVRDAIETTWDVGPRRDVPEIGADWKNLDEDGAAAIWKRDAELIKRDVVAAAAKSDATPVLFSFTPDQGVPALQVRRLAYYGRLLTSAGLKPLHSWGVVLESAGAADEIAFATYVIDTRTTLVVSRLRATEAVFPSLLHKITDTARECGLVKVEVWNMPQNLVSLAEKLVGAKTADRASHLSAFKWYGEETPDSVTWLFNEKFCWC